MQWLDVVLLETVNAHQGRGEADLEFQFLVCPGHMIDRVHTDGVSAHHGRAAAKHDWPLCLRQPRRVLPLRLLHVLQLPLRPACLQHLQQPLPLVTPTRRPPSPPASQQPRGQAAHCVSVEAAVRRQRHDSSYCRTVVKVWSQLGQRRTC